jgi:tetratricopeptide (TPR) repeat protein
MAAIGNRVVQCVTLGVVVLLVGARIGGPPTAAPQPLRPLPPAVLLPSDAAGAAATGRFLENRVKHDPADFIAYNKLAEHYLQRVRETGDLTYLQLAARAARASLAVLSPEQHTGGLTALAHVEYASHEFAAARDHARRLTELEPGKGYPFQILGDALLELGEYSEAEEAFRQMEQRGGIQGLTKVAVQQRLARLAALHGDLDTARHSLATALTLALALPVPPREPVAWCWWQLGETAFSIGDYATAEQHYHNALITFPDYFRALASLGRVRAARGDLSGAIVFYERAVGIMPDPTFVATLGDLLALSGRGDEAEKQYILVEYIGYVNEVNQVAYNRQLALFYADHNRKLAEAVKLAETELTRRHDIYAFDTLAWAYYKIGRVAEAEKAMQQALRLGTQDASLFFHAGMIAQGLGKQDDARKYLRRALETNPSFSLSGAELARVTLAQIEQRPAARGEVHEP